MLLTYIFSPLNIIHHLIRAKQKLLKKFRLDNKLYFKKKQNKAVNDL